METINVHRYLTREECLQLSIETYNMAMESQWEKDKVEKNLSGDLSNCEHCGRKYVICCICDEATRKWNEMIVEVEAVSQKSKADNDYIIKLAKEKSANYQRCLVPILDMIAMYHIKEETMNPLNREQLNLREEEKNMMFTYLLEQIKAILGIK